MTPRLLAVEGMWFPVFISQQIEQMQQMGLNLSSEDLYDEFNASLKDGIVRFGRGCTGSFISDGGLILTNHHCGYGQIQRHSSVENDYLTHGFWAGSRGEELPNPGLTISILVRMEDVTARVVEAIEPGMTETAREKAVREVSRKISDEASEADRYEAQVSPFFYGNEYFLFVYEIYKDVRLVGAPPSSTGKFGGDVDNWMWPRHSGDFSLFRVYAGADNRPSEYHEDNVPYKPAHFFPVSNRTAEPDDFTMVYGFPGSTSRYLMADAVRFITQEENPMGIRLRTRILDLYEEEMEKSAQVRIQYASKHARISNAWKRWMGENRGLERLNAIEVKRQQEAAFDRWAQSDGAAGHAVVGLMDAFARTYSAYRPLRFASRLHAESAGNIEILRFASAFENLAKLSKEAVPDMERIEAELASLREQSERFFRDYHLPTDRKVAEAMISDYIYLSDESLMPPGLQAIQQGRGPSAFVERMFARSFLVSETKTMEFLGAYKPRDHKKLERDPAFSFAMGLKGFLSERVQQKEREVNNSLDSLYRLYTAGLRAMNPKQNFFPDANGTLRIAYGKVEGSLPRDAVAYLPHSTARGILEKAAQEEIADYRIPPRLDHLLRQETYGPYSHHGELVVNFISSNHTSGGNSGSPVIGADGALIGLNFDRSWESTMSDILFDPEQCRNIAVNSQYILWVIDVYAGQGYLLEEMTILP
ncbi:MAG: S46 family peptidase [Bacteroidales bacterium]